MSVLKYLTGSQGISKMPSYISRRFSYTLNMQIKCITESPSAVINRINLRWRSQSQLENLRSRRKCWGLDEGPEPLRVYCRQNTGAGSLTKALHTSHSHPFLCCLFPFSFLLFKYTHKSPLNKNIPWDLSSPCSSQHELSFSSYTDNFFFSFCFVLLKCSWLMGQVNRRIHKLLEWVVCSGDPDHDFPGFWGFPSPPLMTLLCSL